MNGYLPINKDVGPTSHDVVNKIRRIANTKKVGHTGTLDPLASGLMVICIGKCTKAADYITRYDKGYIAKMKLGYVSDTLDVTGNVTKFSDEIPTQQVIENTLFSFLGTQEQLPPMYSAKKVNGRRLYDIARKGEKIERTPHQITVNKIDLLDIKNNTVTFYAHVTKGTYIRSLIDDFGRKLGCGAVMEELQRVETGSFSLKNDKCYTISELETFSDISKLLYPTDKAFLNYEKLIVNEFHEKIIKNGIPLDFNRADIENIYETNQMLRVYNEKNEFFALMEVTNDNLLKLKTTFFDNTGE